MSTTTEHGATPHDPTPGPDARQRDEVARLVDSVRALMSAVATTESDPDALRDARETVDLVTTRLSESTRSRALRTDFDGPGRALRERDPDGWRLFAFNPLGVPLRVRFDEDGGHAELDTGAVHEGPPNLLHGGLSAHMMDCMIGVLLQATGLHVVTASLTVDYRRPTPLDTTVRLRSRIVEQTGRKTIAEGWIERDGVRTVEARGIFVAVDR